MDVVTFDAIAADVEKVLEICRNEGLRTTGTRIDVAARRIRRIAAHVATHKPNSPWPHFVGYRDLSLLIEGSEFATPLPGLPRWLETDPAVVVRDKLKKAGTSTLRWKPSAARSSSTAFVADGRTPPRSGLEHRSPYPRLSDDPDEAYRLLHRGRLPDDIDEPRLKKFHCHLPGQAA